MRSLARHLPSLAARVPSVELGTWPTPLRSSSIAGREVWIKHEGQSHPTYGGNKIRTLEVWFGHARERGATKIWGLGAYGSNHVVAMLVHAARAGLTGAALLFPQPQSSWAIENAGAIIDTRCELVRVRSVALLPFVGLALARRDRHAVVMPPGGATTIGTFGALAAAFELAEQIEAGLAPPPARIVLPIGSTCTAAGLLAGLQLAHAVGVWRWPVPIVHGVRVTPWPVTSYAMIVNLAHATLARVARLGGPRVHIGVRELRARLVVDGRELGPGYGHPTPQSLAALATLTRHRGPRLDGVYSAKAAAALLRLHRDGVGPLVFWATKSEAVLGSPTLEALGAAPRALVDWLRAPAATSWSAPL
ncbi:MAG: pyridoxal-phosphate dependent enzyme [Myxococcales bacterium]|nr:pyridoxal-phosphate dependent enzyme [Myxococcales bacterium]